MAPVSGTQIRRSRVEFDGVYDEKWAWAAEFDYAKNGVAMKDVKLGYQAGNGTSVYVGNQKQPYSLSLEMSSNEEPFAERSIDNFLVASFADRSIGIRTELSGKQWFLAAGLFGDTLKTGSTGGDEGVSTSGRIVYAPLLESQRVIHLGVRGLWREFDTATATVSIKDKTSDFSELSIVDSGALKTADSVTMFGPEFGMSFGPLYVFGEYTKADLDRKADTTLEFDAWHVAAAWTLTGESRAERYRIDAGEFKGLRPARNFDVLTGGIGAIELAARYASINLNDGLFVGGEEDAVSLTLNWYPNRNIRFMTDWTRIVDTDGSSIVRQFAPDMDIFTFRSQYNF